MVVRAPGGRVCHVCSGLAIQAPGGLVIRAPGGLVIRAPGGVGDWLSGPRGDGLSGPRGERFVMCVRDSLESQFAPSLKGLLGVYSRLLLQGGQP